MLGSDLVRRILHTVRSGPGSIVKIARWFKISRTTIYRLLHQYPRGVPVPLVRKRARGRRFKATGVDDRAVRRAMKECFTVKAAYEMYCSDVAGRKLRSLSAFRRYVRQVLQYSRKVVALTNIAKNRAVCLEKYYQLRWQCLLFTVRGFAHLACATCVNARIDLSFSRA